MSKVKDALLIVGAIVGELGVTLGIDYLTNRFIYDDDGYNRYGYDKYGFDRDGYNKNGFDKNNLDREGYDIKGYNIEGYNRSGYNRIGFDREGYNSKGYDIKGFDRNGINIYGYNKEGYNKDGLDKSKNNKIYYKQKIIDMKKYIDKASKQINNQSFDYALQDLRKALEIGTKCLINHNIGQVNNKLNLDDNIKKCKSSRLCDNVMIEELFDAKNHCNVELHDNEYDKGFKEANFVRAIALKLKEYVCNNCLVGERCA